ncbi:4898_t:CDS:2 [Dentiscutata erythropus]|uniref:4898_t:CDS:1 n=1 Tax=Dentiscutata erythropus TaxID=1348616 RepID=A0A9N9H8F2_9GLOM|nr:4898_t:CDS:2 [Dentiscutata erythropus]
MPKRRELTDFECEEIIGLHKGKHSYNEIKELLGRSKILTNRDNRQLIKIVKNNRSKTLEEITESFNTGLNISVSSSTVRRTLHQEGYSEHAAKKNLLFQRKIKKNDLVGVV